MSNLARAPTVHALEIRTSSSTTQETHQTTRPRTFLEKQPYIFGYGAAISLVSPAATAYQLCRLYKLTTKSPLQLLGMSAAIFPHQTVLKAAQMNASTPVKEHLNPWAAFAVVGVLQGGVYGQCNVYFSRALKIGSSAVSMAGIFRGSGFAAFRDTLSQGLPFVCSDAVRTNVVERVYPFPTNSSSSKDETASSAFHNSIQQWTAVLSTSVVATYLSQGLHNCQIAMQANQSLGYATAVKSVWQQHGVKMFYRGAEARVGLLLLVNALNEVLLKPAWAPVPLEDDNNSDSDAVVVQQP